MTPVLSTPAVTSAQKCGSAAPLVAHVIYRLSVGGMENGLVNLLNRIPAGQFRHAIICLSGFTDFRVRLHAPNVEIFDLGKKEGHDLPAYGRLWRLFRKIRPLIVHTRTYGTLDAQLYARLAGVPVRIHGEHGIPLDNLDGGNRKQKYVRKAIDPLVHHYITVSGDLASYLTGVVGVAPERISRIYNGVDIQRFHPRMSRKSEFGPSGFLAPDSLVIGTVGRMEPVKYQTALVRAFIRMVRTDSRLRGRLRLVLAGDGSLRAECETLLRDAECSDLAWFPGTIENVPEALRLMDIFVNPSLGEGMSNSILEAMACALPVVATRVGGNSEIVTEGETGMLCPPDDIAALAGCLMTYVDDVSRIRLHGMAGRRRVEAAFSMDSMVQGYMSVYKETARGRGSRRSGV